MDALVRSRLFYARRKANRLCTRCGEPLAEWETATTCIPWGAKSYLWKENAVDKGLCDRCGKPRNTDKYKRWCADCSKKYSEELTSRARNHKQMAVSLLGGKCNRCGFTNDNLSVFDFHHKDPELKEHHIGRHLLKRKNWKDIEPEILKCELLCANCHRLEHGGKNE